MHTESPAHETLWKLIKDIRFGMLTHRTSTGMLHAHPLTTQNRLLDEQAELYFFISQSGELYERLLTDGEVNVSYADPDEDSYVSVSGQARFVEDRALKEALWSPMAKAWFPGGVSDPDLALLAVRIRHAEYWNVDESKMVQLFQMAKAAITGEPPAPPGRAQGTDLVLSGAERQCGTWNAGPHAPVPTQDLSSKSARSASASCPDSYTINSISLWSKGAASVIAVHCAPCDSAGWPRPASRPWARAECRPPTTRSAFRWRRARGALAGPGWRRPRLSEPRRCRAR